MAIRNIVKEGDPILNKVCRPVTTFDDRLATLLDDMHETMIAADGVGLAGPQVGMLRRLFVVWDTTDAPEEIPEGLYDPVGVVAQTTQRRENLEAVVAALREAGLEPIVKNTICSATRQRQEAAADLASAVDAMVVIGGRNSSNTTRLAEVCALTCPRTFHIESTDELDPAAFAGCRRVGVTAGASTPENQIAAVEAFLRTL